MKIAPLIGFALVLLHAMSMTSTAATKGVTLEPIPLENSEFDPAGHGCQLAGTGAADARYWSTKEHGVADSEWFDDGVAALGSKGGCTASFVLAGDVITPGTAYRVGFGVARWGH